MSRLVRASPRMSATEPITKTGGVDPPLDQRPCDDESVAAVVPAAAQHRDAAIQTRFERRLDRRHHLAAGVLHQNERGNSDLFDGVAVGVAHLRGIQDSHLLAECTGIGMSRRSRL